MPDRRFHDAEMVSAPDPAPPPAGVVKSAGRALQVLEFFEDVRRPARAAEVAAALEMPQSSTSVLMRSLRDLGYLDYDARTRTFLPSPRVALLGRWLDGGPIRDGSLIRLLETLTETTGKTTLLAVRNGIFAQYICTMPAKSTMRFHVSTGSRRSLVASAAGVMLLADQPEAEIRALHRRTVAEIPEFRMSGDEVMANIAQARAEGYFLSRGLVTPGAGALAIRLPAHLDRAGRPMALVLAGLLDELVREEGALADLMQARVRAFLEADPA